MGSQVVISSAQLSERNGDRTNCDSANFCQLVASSFYCPVESESCDLPTIAWTQAESTVKIKGIIRVPEWHKSGHINWLAERDTKLCVRCLERPGARFRAWQRARTRGRTRTQTPLQTWPPSPAPAGALRPTPLAAAQVQRPCFSKHRQVSIDCSTLQVFTFGWYVNVIEADILCK